MEQSLLMSWRNAFQTQAKILRVLTDKQLQKLVIKK